MDSRASLRAMAAISFVLVVCCIFLAGCSSISSTKSEASEKSRSTRNSTTQSESATYEAKDFKVTLPSSWGDNWKVDVSENRREAMNASNYAYEFQLDGQKRFTIECKKFELDSTASVGNSGKCQVEFHPSNSLSPDDEAFIRKHIEVKQNSGSETAKKEAASVPSNDYYMLSLPASLSDAQVKYDEGRIGGKTSMGATTTVMKNGSALFQVCCLSNDWGPQGTQENVSVGSPTKAPSCTVYVIVPAQPKQGGGYDTRAAKAEAEKYAAYVTVL